MEANQNGVPNHDDLKNDRSEQELSIENGQDLNSRNSGEVARHKRKHHADHSVNRKYRVFSNHSSYGVRHTPIQASNLTAS